jgi:L-asparaginase
MVGDPEIINVLKGANVTFEYEVIQLLRKDSLDLTEEDRGLIVETIRSDHHRRFIVTHGTDTMITTAKALQEISHKVIVLTGAMQPAKFRETDAIFNIASAVIAVQLLPDGTYIAMNGRIFDPDKVRKDALHNRFEAIGEDGSV